MYNGKEFIDTMGLNWYDYGARFYDPQIARWHSVDPLAEHPRQIAKSPYAAMWNNPIRYNDPDGRCPECFNDVKDPVEGHIYTSSGNETYVYSNGDWTRQGGDLSEVVVTYEAAESQSAESRSNVTVSDLGKGLVEGFLDPLVFTTSSLLAGVGNTALGLNKKIKRVGLIQALDEGSIDVLSNEEMFSPIGFSFNNGLKREEPNLSQTVSIEDGKRIMKGTVTIVSWGVPTTGLVESEVKFVTGLGIKTGIGNIPDEKKK
jgi:RHS repeat-associated protein